MRSLNQGEIATIKRGSGSDTIAFTNAQMRRPTRRIPAFYPRLRRYSTKWALSIPLSLTLLLSMATPVAEATTPMRAATVVAVPSALPPLPLSDAAMASVEGGWFKWTTGVCLVVGISIGGGLGIFAGLVCNELLDPKSVY
jgi:hypothetical protein